MTQARTSAHPTLYAIDRREPALRATRCAACETTFFPPLGLGCEACGASEAALTPVEIAARGVLRSAATVHVHAGDDIEAPFVVGEIELQDGPRMRGILRDRSGLGDVEVIGRSVEGVWHPCGPDAEGNEVVELRFRVRDGATT